MRAEDAMYDAEDDGPIVVPTSETKALPPCTHLQKRFAARLALGHSIPEAAYKAGIGRSTGYEWNELPQVQDQVARYASQAVDTARRMVIGQVREAVRTVRRVMRDGSGKGAAVELAAAKLILDYMHIDELPVGNQQSRILTFIPRDERDTPEDGDITDTLAVIEAQYREDALPLASTADGLPPDFPRADGERAGGYAAPVPPTPQELVDPQYYRRSLLRE